MISIPFVGPVSLGATVADVLLSDGVDIMTVGEDALKRGTPVYVRAERAAEEVVERLKKASVKVIPVIHGLDLLGFFEVTPTPDGHAPGHFPR